MGTTEPIKAWAASGKKKAHRLKKNERWSESEGEASRLRGALRGAHVEAKMGAVRARLVAK